ncbi:MAG: DUF86 domain-containing protein [Chloroflexota bacterium]|nr:MAG: DUF86 domain-containing protein [Chloroflexota bacterium]
MLDACSKAVVFTNLRARPDLDADEMLVHALINLLTIIGEASSRISDATREANPQIAWRQIAATRNRVVHG